MPKVGTPSYRGQKKFKAWWDGSENSFRVAEGRALGDTTTLLNPAVVETLKGRYAEE